MANILQNPKFVATKDWIVEHRWILLLVGTFGGALGVKVGDPRIQPDPEPPPTFAEIVHDSQIASLRGMEYFNSATYDSLIARGKADSTIAGKLKRRITEPGREHLLPLMALRTVSPDSYNDVRATLKTGILIDALNQATFFNGWGIPHRYWRGPNGAARALPDSTLEEPVEAIIELGNPAIASLIPLLTEERSATHWGANERLQSREAYRVADYALALILRIEGEKFPATRAGRDSLIQVYLYQVVVK